MSEASAQPVAVIKHAPSARLDLRTVKVLIADDNIRSLDLICQILIGFGVRISAQCTSAVDAKAALDRELFDLAILDGEMPSEDGFDIAHHLRWSASNPNRTVPIIIISGYTPKSKILRARDAGANIVVTKPIIPGVLIQKIEGLARHPKPFVACETYCGPDRRYRNLPLPEGVEERRAENLRLMSAPDRPMSQTDIDSLFG